MVKDSRFVLRVAVIYSSLGYARSHRAKRGNTPFVLFFFSLTLDKSWGEKSPWRKHPSSSRLQEMKQHHLKIISIIGHFEFLL